MSEDQKISNISTFIESLDWPDEIAQFAIIQKLQKQMVEKLQVSESLLIKVE